MKKFLLVFWFHFKEMIIGKVAVISMMVTFIGVVLFFGVSHFVTSQEQSISQIAIINRSQTFQVREGDLALPDKGVRVSFGWDVESARQQLAAGALDNIFIISGEDIPRLESISYRSPHLESEVLLTQFLSQQNLAQIMVEEGISAKAAQRILSPIVVEYETIRNPEETFRGFMVSYVFNMALYIILSAFGSQIAMNILNEKSSRVMEIMIAKVKPAIMMYAKIFAVLGTIFATVAVFFAGLLVSSLMGWLDFNAVSIFGADVDFAEIGAQTLILGGGYFILGYLMFGMVFATAGALCTKMEDYQTLAAPVMYTMMVPFFVSLMAPLDTWWAQTLTYIPLFSPFMAFARFTSGYSTIFEAGTTLLLMAVFIAILGKFATRLYVNGVMHYSDKVGFKDIGRLIKK